jgi:hypothetical protein
LPARQRQQSQTVAAINALEDWANG